MSLQGSIAAEEDRKTWMGVLCSADPKDLEAAKNDLTGNMGITYVLKPETGMVMVQGKSDGSGARFSLGEVTVSRCILETGKKYLGASWVIGSDLRHAELAALFDALLQDPDYHDRLASTLMERLKSREEIKNKILARDVSNTRVEFFTLKRGE